MPRRCRGTWCRDPSRAPVWRATPSRPDRCRRRSSPCNRALGRIPTVPTFPAFVVSSAVWCRAASRVARRADRPSLSWYRLPRIRAGRYGRVVRAVALAVVPVARIGRVNGRVVREDRPEPEAVSADMTPVEIVSFEVVPVEAVLLHGSTAVTALETVTTNAFCMTGRADRQHHAQCGERHECDCCLHVAASLLFPLCGMATASGRFILQRSVTR